MGTIIQCDTSSTPELGSASLNLTIGDVFWLCTEPAVCKRYI
jgi:hypothetical protein